MRLQGRSHQICSYADYPSTKHTRLLSTINLLAHSFDIFLLIIFFTAITSLLWQECGVAPRDQVTCRACANGFVGPGHDFGKPPFYLLIPSHDEVSTTCSREP